MTKFVDLVIASVGLKTRTDKDRGKVLAAGVATVATLLIALGLKFQTEAN
ncbi:hypothetical protein [Marivita geojedonensis]|nr:hypothetical protein [Marivita geojedonensis]